MVLGDNADWDCIKKVLRPVEFIERKGFQDLLYEDEEKKIEYWNKIEASRIFYEEKDFCGVDSSLHKDIESRIALTRLKIATSLSERGNYPNITKRFNEIELKLIKIIEEFCFFDDYTVDEIKDRIGRKEGKIYEIVKKYAEKIDINRDNIFENTDIKPGIRIAVKRLLKERTDKIQMGVIEYIKHYGIGRSIIEIESSVQQVLESEQKRGEITRDVQNKIDRLEEELEEAKSISLKKNELEDKLLDMEKMLLQKSFESDNFKNRIEYLEKEKSRISDSYSSIDRLLENRIRGVEDKRKELESKEIELQQLKNNIKSELEIEKNRIVQEELAKIEQMKTDLQYQANAIENEKKSLIFQKEELDDKFNLIKEAVEGSNSGNRFVPKDLAKLYEMDYIGRFDMKMNDELPRSFTNPISGKTHTVNSWGESHTKLDEKYDIYNLFKNEMKISEVETQLPLNVRSRYEVCERKFKLFGKKEPKTIIEAMVLNHWKEYAKNGFDTRQVTLSELNNVLVYLINNAEKGQYFHFIAIASPTGWDERIKTYINSDDFSKNFVSRYISLCLVDNETGELTYNEADERIADYVNFFEPKFDLEKLNKCKTHIQKEHAYDDYVVLDDIIKETCFDMGIVKKALYELEDEKYGKVIFVNDVGLVLKINV